MQPDLLEVEAWRLALPGAVAVVSASAVFGLRRTGLAERSMFYIRVDRIRHNSGF